MVYPQKTTYVDAVALDGGVVEVPPRVLEMVHPVHPVEGTGEAATAYAIVSFVVDERGRIRGAEVEESSEPMLATPAITAIRGWKLRPAQRNGAAIAVRATVRLTFDPAETENGGRGSGQDSS